MKKHLLTTGVLITGLLTVAAPAGAHLPDRDAGRNVDPTELDPEIDGDGGLGPDDAALAGDDDGAGRKDGARAGTSGSTTASDSGGGCSMGGRTGIPGAPTGAVVAAGALLALSRRSLRRRLGRWRRRRGPDDRDGLRPNRC